MSEVVTMTVAGATILRLRRTPLSNLARRIVRPSDGEIVLIQCIILKIIAAHSPPRA